MRTLARACKVAASPVQTHASLKGRKHRAVRTHYGVQANPAHVREELERLAGMLDPPDVDKLVRAVLACAKPPDDAVKLKFLTQPHKEAVEGMCLRAASEEGQTGEGILVGLVGSEDEARGIIESLIEVGVWVEVRPSPSPATAIRALHTCAHSQHSALWQCLSIQRASYARTSHRYALSVAAQSLHADHGAVGGGH